MSKKITPTDFNFNALVELCRQTHEELRSRAIRSVDIAMVVRNWLIGWYIVEFEQNGADRAEYGTRFLEKLSMHLKQIGIRGSSTTRLKLYRSFYLQYKGIRPTLPGEFGRQTPDTLPAIGPTASDKSPGHF